MLLPPLKEEKLRFLQEHSRGDLRAAFLKLCHDETPMVRRAAAQVGGLGLPSVNKARSRHSTSALHHHWCCTRGSG